MPFDKTGSDEEREYLVDGLAEETIASLGQVAPEHLTVFSRSSIAAYQRMGKSLADMGRDLKVDYVVESAVRVEPNRLRVTPRLIRAADGEQVWSASYDRELANMLGVRELSTTIAEQIRLQLVPHGTGKPGEPADPESGRVRHISARAVLREPAEP